MKEEPMLISQQKITPKVTDFFSIFKKKNGEIIKRYVPKNYIYWLGSGREALRQILLNIGGRRVGTPAYTCQVVLDAVKRAGCEPVFYDSGVVPEIKDIERVIKKVDALVVSYNFGFLPEIDKVAGLCKKHNVVLIEDCAQALGARYGGKLAGSFGDYAFYSFGISKNIGFGGGLIGSDKRLEIKGLKRFPISKLIKVSGEALTSNIFFNRYFYPWSRRFLEKELNKRQEALDYNMPGFARRIVLNQLGRYDQILKIRRRNAEYCLRELEGAVDFIKPIKNNNPTWLYFTILTENKERSINKLLKEGVELGEMKTFKCLEEGREKAGEAEEKVLTFALYRELGEIKFMVDKLKKVCR